MQGFRLLRLVLFLCSTLGGLLSSTTYAQSISGKVIAPDGTPIPYATIVLSSDSLSRDILQHTVSKSDGLFVFKDVSMPSGARLWLTVRCLGYQKLTKSITRAQARGLQLQLEEDVTELPDVLIKGISPDVYARGDTVVFSSQNYRIGHEKSLGDVVARMPGIEISPLGYVSFQGQPIRKLLINGADVLSHSVSSNLNTFSSDFADEVEVISDYDDGSIDKALRGEKQVALNLKTSRSLRANGWIDLAGGIRNKYNTCSSLISVLGPLSITTKINANNSGEPWLLWGDYNNLSSSTHTFGGQGTRSIIYNADEAEMLQPSQDMFERNGIAGVGTFIWMPNTKYRVSLNNILHTGGSQKHRLQEQAYLQNTTQLLHNSQTAHQHRSLSFFAHQLEQRWIPSRHFSLETTTRVEYTRGVVEEHLINRIGQQAYLNQAIRDDAKRSYSRVANNIELKQVVGRGLLVLGHKFSFRKSSHRAEWVSNQDLLLLPDLGRLLGALEDSDYHQLQTKVQQRSIRSEAYLGGALPILGGQILRAEVRYNWYNDKRYITQGPTLEGRDDMTCQRLSGYLSLMKNQGLFIYNLSIEGGWHTLNLLSIETKQNHRPAFLAPRIELGLIPSNLHRLLLSSTYGVESYALADLSQITYQDTYRGIRKGTKVDHPFYKTWDNTLEYSYSDLRRQIFANASVRYVIDANYPLIHLHQEGIQYTQQMTDGGKKEKLVARGDGSFSLKVVPIDLKLNALYREDKANFVFNQSPELLAIQEVALGSALQSRFRSFPLNASLGVSFSRVNHAYQQQMLYRHQYLTSINGSLYGHFGGLSFQVSAHHQWLQGGQKVWRLLDISGSLRYTHKKITMEIQGKDLLHLSKNEWVMRDATPEYMSTAIYQQMPGYLMLSFRYAF